MNAQRAPDQAELERQVEVHGPRPRYLRVVDQVIGDIRSGRLAPGQRLASERELSERFNVSRDTLRRALTKLADGGHIEPSPRRGWFVSTGPVSEPLTGALGFGEWAATHGLPTTARVLHAGVRGATDEEARELDLATGDQVFELRRLRSIGSVPISLDRSVIVLSVAPHLPEIDFARNSLYASLRKRAGVRPSRSEWEARATIADDATAALLDVKPGDPLLNVVERVSDQHGRVFEFATSVNRGDLYRYRTSIDLNGPNGG